jgi:hypothetical protein
MVWQGKKGWETEGLFLREEGQQLRQTISKCLSSLKVSWRHKTFPDTYALVLAKKRNPTCFGQYQIC